ncbi:hypothetical protein [Mycolicibacterium fluoranthenivorans]|uniref:Uncharacterized protein n=1 Tax=Mycolicibacterium fluoranthenivorans TaxID=258505 RepID=A0A7X5U2X5_9MYCO|nr:hypothetical protein [Mycolicibacterium fluoranthenivorans]MCV7354087.1 hypothetical protein [Mycolicibacterium fluoranthenivorans]NIH97352.1 hypothetical protein [Mycolicibacterium fluoranthenivorans]
MRRVWARVARVPARVAPALVPVAPALVPADLVRCPARRWRRARRADNKTLIENPAQARRACAGFSV